MDNAKTVKVALIISIIAVIISIVTIVSTFSTSSEKVEETKQRDETKTTMRTGEIPELMEDLGIAYIDIDTLLLEYKLSIKLNEELLTQQARSRANLENQIKQFERDYNSFMEKVQLGSFLSQASMESQQQELIQQQQRLEMLDRELTEGLMIKQQEMNEQLYDTIMNFMKEFENGSYNLVLGNAAGSAVLYAKPGMNITREVIDALNERYDKRHSR